MSPKKEKNLEALSFEDALQQLEQIVSSLEDGNLPLEEAIANFETGTALKKICEERLSAAEQRIEVLLNEEGELIASPMDRDNDEEAAEE